MKLFRNFLFSVAILVSPGILAQNCTGDYTWSVNGNNASFTGMASANVDNVIWDFGDGSHNYSNELNVSHIYSVPGTYRVCIEVYDSVHACSDSTCHDVTVSSCNADFTAVDSMGYVFFVNTSSLGAAGVYYWDFGDGQYSSQYNPSNVYSVPGTYLVCLVAYDSAQNFCDSTCHYVTVNNTAAGLKEKANHFSNLLLSPNPADGNSHLSFNLDQSATVSISVYDIAGRMITDFGTVLFGPGEQDKQISTASLSPGTYFLRVSAGGQVSNTKLVITHRE